MQLKDFTLEEKKAFLALSKKLTAADGVFDDKEITMLKSIYNDVNLNEDDNVPTEKSIKELADVFETKDSKISCLLKLSSLALIDQDYAKEEKDLLNELAELFGVTKREHLEMLDWVEKSPYLTNDVEQFL